MITRFRTRPPPFTSRAPVSHPRCVRRAYRPQGAVFCGALGIYMIPQVIQWAGQQFMQILPDEYAVIGQGIYFFGYILAFFLLFQLRQKLTRCGPPPKHRPLPPSLDGESERHLFVPGSGWLSSCHSLHLVSCPVTVRRSFGITEDSCTACVVVCTGVICAAVRA